MGGGSGSGGTNTGTGSGNNNNPNEPPIQSVSSTLNWRSAAGWQSIPSGSAGTTSGFASAISSYAQTPIPGESSTPTSNVPQQLARISSATAENPSPTSDTTPVYDQFGHGHYFTKKTFHKPTYCHHCTDMLWGLIGQGLICEVCNFVVHERCLKTVVSPCSTVASNVIKVCFLFGNFPKTKQNKF